MSDEEEKCEKAEVPEGHKAIYFQIGRDSFDGAWAFSQTDEDGCQIYTDIEWEGAPWNGVIFMKEDMPKKRIELYLGLKEEMTLTPYRPVPAKVDHSAENFPIDFSKWPFEPEPNFEPEAPSPVKPFDDALNKAFDTWGRIAGIHNKK